MRSPALPWLAVLLALAPVGVGAQTAATPGPRPVPPAGPLLGKAPDFSAWQIVRYTIPGLGSQPADQIVRGITSSSKPDSVTSVTKTGAIRHQTRKLKAGELEDIWYEHGNRITMESMWKVPMFASDFAASNLPTGPDFPDLAWISAANFVGIRNYQNIDYLVFEAQVNEGNPDQARQYGYKLVPTFKRAYINAAARVPWLLQTADVLQRYDFQAAPTGTLDVPPAYQAMFDTFEKNKIESARRPIAP